MRRLSLTLISAVSALAFTQIASAADLPRKAPAYMPPPPPVYSWTGFYVGVNAGYGWADTSADMVATNDPGTTAFFNQAGINGPTFSDSFASSFHQHGAIGGFQAGYNWQFANTWVAGFEADFQFADVTGSFDNRIFLQPGFFGTAFPFDLNSERKLDWFGTVRGRLGYLATPDLLVYGTAGLAYGHTKSSASITLAPPAGFTDILNFPPFACSATGPATSTCLAGSGSRTSAGWAAGAGIEYKLWASVTAKLEYLHIELGDETLTLVSPSPPSSGASVQYGFDRERVDIVRAGLNYHF